MPNEPVPIDDDEIVYRRIPVSQEWYVDGLLYSEAFAPRKDDTTGLA